MLTPPGSPLSDSLAPVPATPAAETPPPTAPKPARRFTVGTLTYTTGSLALLAFWMSWGDFAWQLKERSVPPVVQVLLKKFSASDTFTAFILGTLPAAIGLLLVPIVSYRSDRHRGRWGRRIPYLLAPTPIIVLTMFLLAASPALGGQLHAALGEKSPGLNICVLGLMALSWGAFEVATTIANALFGALVNDVVPKEMLGRFFGLFRAVSLLAGIVFNKFIFGYSDNHYAEIFIGMGLVYAAGFTLMCLKVKEGGYPPPPAPIASSRPGIVSGVATYFRETYRHPFYVLAGCLIGLVGLVFMPVNFFSVYYAESVGMSRQSFGDHLATGYTISLGLAYFLGALADRFHPLRMGIVSLALYLAVTVWASFYARDPGNFGIAFVAHVALSGTFFTTTASLGARLFPKERFAQFVSAFGILGNVASMIMPLILGVALDWNGRHYPSTFVWSASLTTIALLGLLALHTQFMRRGGPKGYTPDPV
ncbi:MAG: MFS transporter [Opitutaceae bacterium]|nr:MFS transporter [Opitutaceae bacterium]